MPVRVIRSDDQQWDEVPRPQGYTAPPLRLETRPPSFSTRDVNMQKGGHRGPPFLYLRLP